MNDRDTVATELQFQTLLDCTDGVAVFVLDVDGQVVSWNAGAERMTGRTADDVVGQPLSVFYRPCAETETPASLCDAVTRNGRAESTGWGRGPDEERRRLDLELRPAEDGTGTEDRFVAVLREHDGEDTETDEDDRRVGERRDGIDDDRSPGDPVISDGLFEVAGDALYRLDTDRRFVTVSEGVASITGYSQEQLLGEHVSRLFDAETAERLHPLDGASTAPDDGDVRTATTALKTVDGSSVRCEVRSRMVGTGDRVRGSVGVVERASDRVGDPSSPAHRREVVQRLLDTAPVALAVRESQTGVTVGNARGRELFGFAAEDDSRAVGPSVRFFDAEGEPMAVDDRPIRRAERTLEPVYGEELVVERAGGSRRSLRVDAVPVTDETGELRHVVAVAEDVTERKQRTETLRQQRRQLRTELSEVLDRVTDAVFALDTEWRFTYVNETGEKLLRRTEEELLGESVWDAFPEAVGTTFEDEYREVMRRQEPTTFVEYFPPLSAWFEVRAYPSETGVSAYFRDVSDRHRRKQELEQYEAVVETVDDAVYVVDGESRFAAVNDAFTSLVGYSRSELLGEKSELLRADDVGGTVERLTREQLDGDRTRAVVESEIRRRDGSVFPAATTVTPFPSDDGGCGRVGVVRDISEHRERERQLESLSKAAGRLLDADSQREMATIAVDTAAGVLDGPFVSVALYDETSGALRPQTGSATDGRLADVERLLDPEAELAWQAYVDGERYVFEDVEPVDEESDPFDVAVYPLGRHGVFLLGGSPDPKTASFARILAANTESALDRGDREARLVEQQTQLREQNRTLGRLNRVNGVTRQVLRTLVDATSRAEIERSVCEQLTTTGPYRFAWIGGRDVVDDTVAPRTSAGFENGYLSELRALTDRTHPSVRAVESADPVVVDDLHDDPPFDTWRSEALKRGYQSLICLPLRYHGTSYGVLCVYADRPDVFDEMERSVLRELSNTTAYAINAVESKRSLVGDADVELELTVEDDSVSYLRASEELDCSLELDDLVTQEEGGLRAVFTARGVDSESFVAHTKQTLDVRELRLVDESGSDAVFECTVGVEHIFQTFVDYGVVPRRFDAADGVGNVTVTVSDQFDVRSFVETLRTQYDRVELTARRERPRESPTLGEMRAQLNAQLTDRQRQALETAFANGFFESPRSSTEREIADRLGIAQSTLNGHLRAAQRKVLEYLYEPD
ncbi:PAS domain S-box protein [Haloprofundus sp. MHR1]|uniref:PAS domain S-box protein n=1 Tax=Haloprofundus sp. MHR1 TaxID=2572921 RepID=UPI0010BEA8CB|nr:PAS domain S-box protein [Haloprofundus sp. MHR1]QCJ47127.1 PAS domain S-box protein [Haloprofundus sp. MHR1]